MPARPQLRNFPLNKDKSSARPLLITENTLFLCILCRRGGFICSPNYSEKISKSNQGCKYKFA